MRNFLRLVYAPALFCGAVGAGLLLVDSGTSKLGLIGLVLIAIVVTFAVERVIPYQTDWNHDHGDRVRDLIHFLINEGAVVISVMVVPIIAEIRPWTGVWPVGWPLWIQLVIAIGEVIGLLIGVSLGLNVWLTMGLATVLAYISGFTLGLVPVIRREHVDFLAAFKMIWIGEAVSIGVMELVMNGVDYVIGGVQAISVFAPIFWIGLAFAIPAGFLAAWPVNWWLLKRNLKACH